jgi:hypothetical protein
MNYSKKNIGEELNKLLEKKYDVEQISTWACDLLVKIKNDATGELDQILDRISLMDAGPEFEYTEQELRLLAELLIREEKNPIQQIDDRRLKDTA